MSIMVTQFDLYFTKRWQHIILQNSSAYKHRLLNLAFVNKCYETIERLLTSKVTKSRCEFYTIIPGTIPIGLINPSPIGPRGLPPLIDPRGLPLLRLPRLLGTPPTVLSTKLPFRVLPEMSPGTIPARSTACQVGTGVAREVVAAT